MVIRLSCSCGAKLLAKEANVGKRLRCPRCHGRVVVAGSTEAVQGFDEDCGEAEVPSASQAVHVLCGFGCKTPPMFQYALTFALMGLIVGVVLLWSSTMAVFLLGLSVLLLFGVVPFAYVVAVWCNNRWTFMVDDERLVGKYGGPMVWLRLTTEVPRDDVECVFVKRKDVGETGVDFYVYVALNRGWPKRLVHAAGREQAEEIVGRIQAYLEKTATTVPPRQEPR